MPERDFQAAIPAIVSKMTRTCLAHPVNCYNLGIGLKKAACRFDPKTREDGVLILNKLANEETRWARETAHYILKELEISNDELKERGIDPKVLASDDEFRKIFGDKDRLSELIKMMVETSSKGEMKPSLTMAAEDSPAGKTFCGGGPRFAPPLTWPRNAARGMRGVRYVFLDS
jgi:hypothetical protein